MAQDCALELMQLRTRLDPQLVDQHPACLAVHGECVDLAPGSVQREHQLAAQALTHRMRGDERLQLSDEVGVTAERKLGLDPVFERRHA